MIWRKENVFLKNSLLFKIYLGFVLYLFKIYFFKEIVIYGRLKWNIFLYVIFMFFCFLRGNLVEGNISLGGF